MCCRVLPDKTHGRVYDADCSVMMPVSLYRRAEPGQGKLTLQEDELEAVTWMPLEEYSNLSFHQERPLLRQIAECCTAYAKGTYAGMQACKLNNGHKDPWPSREDLFVFGKDF